VVPGSSTHVAVRLVLAAKQAVSRVEAAMVDSLNVRRESSDAATLAAVGAGETAELHFVVIAVSPIPLRMRGNLTFLVCFVACFMSLPSLCSPQYGLAGDMRQGQLDLTLPLPASSFVAPVPCTAVCLSLCP
jgi:hypothetical protein